MKAIISTDYNDTYIYFLPITVFCWHKLGLGTICFMPYLQNEAHNKRIDLINDTFRHLNISPQYVGFYAPKHKEATYTQLSRLMISGAEWFDENEVYCTSDIDMLNFKIPPYDNNFDFTVWGSDLTPNTQYPVCYITGSGSSWQKYFNPTKVTHQEKMDFHLGGIECESFKGNYWCFEQEQIFNSLQTANCRLIPRSNGQNQFALQRIDRTDLHYKDRLGHDIIDAHLWRDGYTEENHVKIMELLQFMYPQENLDWLCDYRNAYLKLL